MLWQTRENPIQTGMTDLSHISAGTASGWRNDVDALIFQPDGHGGACMVHRHAFRTLLRRNPSPEDCHSLFAAQATAFQLAAAEKIARTGMAPDTNLHLTSRDLVRAMGKLTVASGEQSS